MLDIRICGIADARSSQVEEKKDSNSLWYTNETAHLGMVEMREIPSAGIAGLSLGAFDMARIVEVYMEIVAPVHPG